ncbi:MAG TPA: lytic transglycosylase domain-containing protein [Rhizomicrobium sp.]
MQSVAKMTFMAGIAAGILLTWQAITVHVQQFSVRSESVSPVAAVARWVHTAWTAALPQPKPAPPRPDPHFAAEQGMSHQQLMNRWNPLIVQAAQRFSIPAPWIRAVMQTESGGRTMSAAFKPITSHAGAMGLMQLMPATYAEMRAQYRLGANPYDPHDNIIAGVGYLGWLYHKYGYPAMFAAYNDGPGHLEDRLAMGGLLPAETRNYITHIETALAGNPGTVKLAARSGSVVAFTRPDGAPVKIDLAKITSVRVPLPGEYADSVKTVITIGDRHQGVGESYDEVKQAMLTHGALGAPIENSPERLAGLVDEPSRAARNRNRHHARLADTIRLHPLSRRAQG